MTTEAAQPTPRKGGPRDIPAHVGARGRKTKAERDAAIAAGLKQREVPQPEMNELEGEVESATSAHEGASRVVQTDGVCPRQTAPAVLSTLTADQRVRAVKAHIQKGDQCTSKAEQHYISAGRHLDALKREEAHKAAGLTWEMYAKDVCGISRSRADELIMIADGRTTLEETRAGKRGRVKKSRAQKPPLRSGGSSAEATEAKGEEPTPQAPAAEVIAAEMATIQAEQPRHPIADAPRPALTTRKQEEGIEIPSDLNLTLPVKMRVERTENLVRRARAAGLYGYTDAELRRASEGEHHLVELTKYVRQWLADWDQALDDVELEILDAEKARQRHGAPAE